MPYIKKEEREVYDSAIADIVTRLHINGTPPVGHVNYVISSIIWELFRDKVSYTNGNNLVGVLECVKQEFYRRQLSGYEDEKIIENGDI